MFSTHHRQSHLVTMAEKPLDLLVIGGGITGAGIALDAAVRGLKVGLVEKRDFASGTSNKSTKLIHGGLRYLKQGEVGLVREVGRERAIVYKNAKHIVTPEKMLLPLVQNGTYGRLATSFGLWLYDLLAGVRRHERRIMLSKDETLQAEPLLRKDILKGAGLYYEYRTDDARLTIEVLKTASSYGALCANYAEVVEFVYENGKVIGAKVMDVVSGASYVVRADKIVNATGPWVDEIRKKDGSLKGKHLHLTKGVHVVVPFERLPIKQSVYFDVPDGRMIFAIPRGDSTYIGTTDTDYTGNINTPQVTREDVLYLLAAVNWMFPHAKLTIEDVTSSWAGLRPLINEEGKLASELSRKDEIFHSPTGLISIAGGKLTGYRKMAQRVVDLILKQLGEEQGRKFVPCTTDQVALSGGNFSTFDDLVKSIREGSEWAQDIPQGDILRLAKKYGSNTRKIVATAEDEAKQRPNFVSLKMVLAKAELRYSITEEMAVTPSDYLIRRSGRLFFERPELDKLYLFIHEQMATELGWDAATKDAYLRDFEREYFDAVAFKESNVESSKAAWH
jgi:glycerol-3-phosphate dehydrogenase